MIKLDYEKIVVFLLKILLKLEYCLLNSIKLKLIRNFILTLIAYIYCLIKIIERKKLRKKVLFYLSNFI